MSNPLLYSTSDACRVLNVGKTKLFELIRTGELESVQIGSARLIPADACAALVDRLRRHPDAVERLIELVDERGCIDVAQIPSGTTLADLEQAKRLIAQRRQAAA